MPIQVLDVVVIVVLLISAVLAMVRGFVREVLSVASWVAAAAAGYFFYKPVLPLVKPYFSNESVAEIVAAAAVFFVALIIASYITMKISDFVIDSRAGAVDRGFGFVFGVARGMLLLVVAFHFFTALVPKPPAWVADARTKPLLEDLDRRLTAALPKDLAGLISKKSQEEEPADSGQPPADDATPPPADDAQKTPTADKTPPAADPASPKYNSSEQNAIEQLIENSAKSGAPAQ